ncbi:hypothetical protein TVAG_033380 [Trichomonas vaginalis G3]|uniref:Rab-GAP TBC domain-containing protein n=1 Tax=Trichomonas vaginalis (strain ATCC PRA-98 / G3) TaxID=412133 RepID=A2FJ03_TRIV3|nr:regulation of vesicle fusion [Trichomonas vaginalis G3]EAX95118.1 hypothetical protein TVAG_033380 [Trichomonas vaginalis G3]KAI5524607.1 regulation of vesicle fusion [Trichomonas vaginalis G3]|eukprot:XP_001308048.1 hypothetical protein [Trichomonas vaginalis G3]
MSFLINMESDNLSSKVLLAVIRSVKEITPERSTNDGILALMKNKSNFYILWQRQLNNSKESRTKLLKSLTLDATYDWSYGNSIFIPTTQLSKFEFGINPLTLIISHSTVDETRYFSIQQAHFAQFVFFVEKLLTYGIAHPKHEKVWSLRVLQNVNPNFGDYISPDIILETNTDDLKRFWIDVVEYYIRIIRYVQKNNQVEAFNILQEFDCDSYRYYIFSTVNRQIEPQKTSLVSLQDIMNSYDENGVLQNFDQIKSKIYLNGVETDAIIPTLSYLLSIYPVDSTKSQREEIDKKLKFEYETFCEQSALTLEEQIKNNRTRNLAQRVIMHDVIRTDRQHPAFKDQNGIGLSLLTRILKAYEIYNPNLGYVQGMNDMVVPFIDLFIPKWNENGQPTDKEGNLIDVGDVEYKIFWYNAYFLLLLKQDESLARVAEFCKEMAAKTMKIINKISPPTSLWLHINKLTDLMWGYSDYVMLFKRSITDIWPVWSRMLCSESPNHWFVYFIAGTVVELASYMSKQQRVVITAILTEFTNFMTTIDPMKICDFAYYFMKKYYVQEPKEEEKKEVHEDLKYEFFKLYCE